jgi:hypothetical protein
MDEIAVFLKEAKAGTTVVAEASVPSGDALAFAPQ